MKYIIEIEEMPFASEGSEMQLFKATEFNSLVFGRNGLEKLTPYDESAAEQRGWKEAWELARHLYNVSPDVTDVIYQSMNGGKGLGVAFEMTYAEAKAEYDAWKEEKNKIKVGDEVAFHHSDGRPDTVVVVTYICSDGYIDGMDGRGTQYVHKNPDRWTKTGRTFPEVADLLEKMRKPE